MSLFRALVASVLLATGLAGCTIPEERGRTSDFARTPANLILPHVKVTAGPTGRSVEGPIIDSIEPGYTWISARLKGFVPYAGGASHEAVITLSYRYHTWYDFTAAKGRPGELRQIGRDWRCKGTDCNRSETVAVRLSASAIADAKSGILVRLISKSGVTAEVWIPLSYATAYRTALVRARKAPDGALARH